MRRFIIPALAVVAVATAAVQAGEIQLDVKHKVLDNGMRILVLENHTAPVVSTFMRFNVGSVDEKPGITGTSHLLEHMMFKGTETMGTRDYEAEKPLMAEIDRLAAEWEAEKSKLLSPYLGGSQERADALRDSIAEVQAQLSEYVIKDELWGLYLKNGGTFLNASTGQNSTQYYVQLPKNRLELWAFMEADRIAHPVLREFYSERDVVYEERRLRTENSPNGKLWEQFNSTAFIAHPYGWPVVGWASDIATVDREEVAKYFKRYYAPNNCVAGVVGDVDAEEVFALCEKYFGPIPAQPPPDPVFTQEPEPAGEKRIEVEYDAEPSMLIGYMATQMGHPDQPALEVASSVLTDGRTSRLYKKLVDEKIARYVWSGDPGMVRYPDLFVFGTQPLEGHTCEEIEEIIYAELELLKTEPVTEWELDKVRNQIEAAFINQLNSNMGMAIRLASWEQMTGDWNNMIAHRDALKAVTADDIMRVAKKYFDKKRRTVAILVKPVEGTDVGSDPQAMR
jgi:predicted Zn-dependent peptidase